MRIDHRENNQIRPILFETDFTKNCEGSVLTSLGNTKVLSTVSVEERVPHHRTEGGWVTAEYAMLPGSTQQRKKRDRGKIDGRNVEIQRLIGRSLRAVVDMKSLGQRTLWIDCDVIQADGSTRCASISGASVALAIALKRLEKSGHIVKADDIMKQMVAAVSVGIVNDQIVVDLSYAEDSNAQVDMNIVGTCDGKIIEIQGTAEDKPFESSLVSEMVLKASCAIKEIATIQKEAIENRK